MSLIKKNENTTLMPVFTFPFSAKPINFLYVEKLVSFATPGHHRKKKVMQPRAHGFLGQESEKIR